MTDASRDSQRILRERAQSLARVPSAGPAAESTLDLLEFRLASERYGLETRYVHEVHPLRELTSTALHAGVRAGHCQCARQNPPGPGPEEVFSTSRPWADRPPPHHPFAGQRPGVGLARRRDGRRAARTIGPAAALSAHPDRNPRRVFKRCDRRAAGRSRSRSSSFRSENHRTRGSAQLSTLSRGHA